MDGHETSLPRDAGAGELRAGELRAGELRCEHVLFSLLPAVPVAAPQDPRVHEHLAGCASCRDLWGKRLAMARELAELRPSADRSSTDGASIGQRPALQSFQVALRAVEARELAGLQAAEAHWRPRIKMLPGPKGEPLGWPQLQGALGLGTRRRLLRIQGLAAGLAAAGLLVAALLGQEQERSEWETLQATATPVTVTIREGGAEEGDDPASKVTPWSFPGGAP